MISFSEYCDDVLKELQIKAPDFDYEKRDDLYDEDGQPYTAILAKRIGGASGLTLNLNIAYKAVEDGVGGVDDFVDFVLNSMQHNIPDVETEQTAMERINDYDKARENLSISIIPVEGHEFELACMPYKIIGDMAAVYRVDTINEGTYNIVSVPITNDMLDKWGITSEQLKEDAAISAPKIRRPVLMPWHDFVVELSGHEVPPMVNENGEEAPIYIGTTLIAIVGNSAYGMEFGASVIEYPGYLEQVSELCGGDFYMIPIASSQLLFAPCPCNLPHNKLQGLLEMMNAQNDRNDLGLVLSNQLYCYDSETHVLETESMFNKTIETEQSR